MSEPGGQGGSPQPPSSAPALRPIDSHCHLADEAFKADIVDVVLRARTAGAPTALCIIDAGEVGELRRAPASEGAVAERALRGRRAPDARRHLPRRSAGRGPGDRERAEPHPGRLRARRDGARLPLRLRQAAAPAGGVRGPGEAGADAPAAGHRPHPRSRPGHRPHPQGLGQGRGPGRLPLFHGRCRARRRRPRAGLLPVVLRDRLVSRSRTRCGPSPRRCRPTGSSSKPTARTWRRCRTAASGTSRRWSSTWPKRWPPPVERRRPQSSSRRPRTSRRCSESE